MILEKYFPAVIKIYRTYFIALAIADRQFEPWVRHVVFFNRNKSIVAKRYVVKSWRYVG